MSGGGGFVTENRPSAQQKTERMPVRRLYASRTPIAGGSIPSIGEIGLNQFATYLMNRVVATWNGQMQEALRDYDLTTVKMRTLAVLAITPGLTVNEFSMFTVTEQSTMSRMLDAMEDQGLIRRQPREDDLRVREVHPTTRGREAFSRFWPKMYESFTRLFRGDRGGRISGLRRHPPQAYPQPAIVRRLTDSRRRVLTAPDANRSTIER